MILYETEQHSNNLTKTHISQPSPNLSTLLNVAFASID